MRDLSKCGREELLSLARRRGDEVTRLEANLAEVRAELAAERIRHARTQGALDHMTRWQWAGVVGLAAGAVAGGWCLYLIGSGVLVWPWEVGGGA